MIEKRLNAVQYITQGKLNRMCRYFRNKRVKICFEYANSIGDNDIREIVARYDKFELKVEHGAYGSFYVITFWSKDVEIFYQELDQSAYFTGVGKIQYCNSGPYCYFSIEKVDGIFDRCIHG